MIDLAAAAAAAAAADGFPSVGWERRSSFGVTDSNCGPVDGGRFDIIIGGERLRVLPPRRLVAVVLRGPELLAECTDAEEGGRAGIAFVIIGITETLPSSFAGGVEDATGVDSFLGPASSSFVCVGDGVGSL